MSCETALYQCFDAFSTAGRITSFSEVEQLLDAVSHEKYTLVMDGKTFERNTVMEFDAGYLARGSKVEVIDPRRIDQIASTCECERKERRLQGHPRTVVHLEETRLRWHRWLITEPFLLNWNARRWRCAFSPDEHVAIHTLEAFFHFSYATLLFELHLSYHGRSAGTTQLFDTLLQLLQPHPAA